MHEKISLLLLALLLTACDAVDTMTEGLAHSQEVASDLERSVGIKPLVGFNWSNGLLTNINITFEHIPTEKSTSEILHLSRKAVAKHFKQTPQKIIISFALPGSERE